MVPGLVMQGVCLLAPSAFSEYGLTGCVGLSGGYARPFDGYWEDGLSRLHQGRWLDPGPWPALSVPIKQA